MKPKVYIETSVISYLTARISRDLIVAGHQRLTQEWWATRREAFDVSVSQVVFEEASAGDPEAARERLVVLTTLPLLELSEEAVALAKDLIGIGPLPARAEVDALHIAIAVTNQVDYLLTWNCKHLANAALRHQIQRRSRSQALRFLIKNARYSCVSGRSTMRTCSHPLTSHTFKTGKPLPM
jgi:hypothetical protein